ncbi:response regulator [Arenicella xantha]|uniref:LuxR family two component transcriptional regulator n=1 Tax=Arenicella xantha TaxID=644221 RepID=A0A395JGG5_9GAMM|nr:response regulator transcription factor [Arenicella xantha]RBP49080.1 LuxR family two component transcriptional regulator [Arenicella xantha]
MKDSHILIVDDHALFRTGMQMILTQVGEARGISEASSIRDAFDFCESSVDLILLDIHLPGLNGIDGIKPLREKFSGVPIIILSASSEHSAINDARHLGAAGFLNKAALAEEMVSSISHVLNGGTCFPEDTDASHYVSPAGIGKSLTPRQVEVLIYLCEGKPNKLIARELEMSENTVRVHVSAILAALGASNRSEAILIAQREGLTT